MTAPEHSPALVAYVDQLVAAHDAGVRVGHLAAALEARCRNAQPPPRPTLDRLAALRLRLDADRLSRSCVGCEQLDPADAELVLLHRGSPRLVCPVCLPWLLDETRPT